MFFQRPSPGFSALTAARIASRSASGSCSQARAELGLADLVALGLNLVAGLSLLQWRDRRGSALSRLCLFGRLAWPRRLRLIIAGAW